jgi:hypothetical protein
MSGLSLSVAAAAGRDIYTESGSGIVPHHKGRKTMNYTKPEVAVLGDAIALIEHITTKGGAVLENLRDREIAPAYDLDE